ncbi:TPA: N-6 DNA methylase [Neisseria meningitidis]
MRAFIKNYVLTLLFLKYVSDKHKYGGGMIELHADTTFDDIVKLKNTADIGDRLNKIIAQIAEANDLKGVIDVADFNDEDKLGKGKEMIDRLSRLVGIFEKLNLSSNQAEDDDLLGDAYEYLMRHFATESGKSKGQFYTPAEVSRIMAKIIGISADCPSSTGNTLSDSSFRDENDGLKTFDFAVANSPYPARKKRRLRLFAASAQKPETKRQRCDYSSARCAVSRQCRSAYSHGIA